LDLLNVRYVVIPRQQPLEPMDAAAVARFPRAVYTDELVEIRENPAALPRAWMVHTAVQATRTAALAALASGQVDARQTALLEEAPPPMTMATNPAADLAIVTVDGPDHLSVSTASDAAGVLVLSEIDYPAWKASIDGQPANVLVADATLRAVPVPAGVHTVELEFESRSLWLGSVISGLAVGVLALVAGLALILQRSIRGSPHTGRCGNKAHVCHARRTISSRL
jgi:hypothetical protein